MFKDREELMRCIALLINKHGMLNEIHALLTVVNSLIRQAAITLDFQFDTTHQNWSLRQVRTAILFLEMVQQEWQSLKALLSVPAGQPTTTEVAVQQALGKLRGLMERTQMGQFNDASQLIGEVRDSLQFHPKPDSTDLKALEHGLSSIDQLVS